jgi:hypothetical protein
MFLRLRWRRTKQTSLAGPGNMADTSDLHSTVHTAGRHITSTKVPAMNSIAPQDIWRSEAFAEDLFDDSSNMQADKGSVRMLSSTLLCAVPVVVALLGGVVAFFHTVG